MNGEQLPAGDNTPATIPGARVRKPRATKATTKTDHLMVACLNRPGAAVWLRDGRKLAQGQAVTLPYAEAMELLDLSLVELVVV